MRLRLKFRKNFNPRPPHGGRHSTQYKSLNRCRFQSTPPTRRATRLPGNPRVEALISIHAPHTEGDGRERMRRFRMNYFNPRPPHGGRPREIGSCLPLSSFQSTPPTRRATYAVDGGYTGTEISIHAPHTEGDVDRAMQGRLSVRFQSTPPTRRATRLHTPGDVYPSISIHAPHTEGDLRNRVHPQKGGKISIHAPHTEGDVRHVFNAPVASDFNPRPPHGGRPPFCS